MRIGFISIYFDRGQSVVSKTLMEILRNAGHEIFLLSRMGSVYGMEKQETQGEWYWENTTCIPTYEVPLEILECWVEENEIDIVVFNEEYDFSLPLKVKEMGRTSVTYLDYYKEDWDLSCYDIILCSTYRTFNLVAPIYPQAKFIGWAIDPRKYPPSLWQGVHLFFHNAGYIGMGSRKGTDLVLTGFDIYRKMGGSGTLLIHSQVPLDNYHSVYKEIVERYCNCIEFVHATLPPPGLYHRGLVYVYPARMDGLGLSLLEALSVGLFPIVTDAVPWTEFTGKACLPLPVRSIQSRSDGIAFQYTSTSAEDVAYSMLTSQGNQEYLMRRRRLEYDRQYVKKNMFSAFSDRVVNAVKVSEVLDRRGA